MYKPATDPRTRITIRGTSDQLQQRPSRLKQAILNLSLVVVAVVFTLALCEVFLRLLSPGYSPLFLDIYRIDENGVLLLRPNIERRHLKHEFDVKVVTNSDGLRDWATPASDKNGRVFGVGDSIAFGWGVELEQSFFSLTEDALRAAKIRVVKAGIPVTGTLDQFRLLKQYGDSHKPRAVIVSFCVFNDFSDNLAGGVPERFTVRDGLMVWYEKSNKKIGKNLFEKAWEWKEELKRSSLLAQKAAQGWWYVATQIVKQEDRTDPALFGRALWENNQILKHSSLNGQQSRTVTLKSLDDIRMWCEERKIPMVVLIIPHSLQIYQWELAKWQQTSNISSSEIDLEGPQRVLSEWAAQNKVTVADLLPHFRAYQQAHPEDRLYFYPDMHLNVTGHREAATVLTQALKGVLKSPVTESSTLTHGPKASEVTRKSN